MVARNQYLKEMDVRIKSVEGRSLYSSSAISRPSDAISVLQKEYQDADREIVFVVNLNSKLRPINFSIVSMGNISGAMVDVGTIFKRALLANAAKIILVHIHPSGDPTPSLEDRIVTERFIKSGKLIGIPVIDHVIIGSEGHNYSMKESTDLFESEQKDMKAVADM